ncbi:MAG: threonine transporter RhtB [Cellvibrionaceae bacterium]|nr:threonine transporter RhtB [Cellvibrionaceae bacterium]
MNTTLLSVFVPTFLFVSATPGMCMTLALTLGMQIGVRRTLWMMAGELVAVGLVATAAVVGVAAIMLRYPEMFVLMKIGGGLYLFYLGVQLWRSQGNMAVQMDAKPRDVSPRALMLQGFVTAIANPKGWAFFIALLPPFIDPDHALLPQMTVLLSLILLIEWLCLMGYALGGRTLSRVLRNSENVALMNRTAGLLMLGVAVWLVVS